MCCYVREFKASFNNILYLIVMCTSFIFALVYERNRKVYQLGFILALFRLTKSQKIKCREILPSKYREIKVSFKCKKVFENKHKHTIQTICRIFKSLMHCFLNIAGNVSRAFAWHERASKSRWTPTRSSVTSGACVQPIKMHGTV